MESADRAGSKYRPAERIGAHVARRLLAEVDRGATIDRNASDHIIPFAALADGTSSFHIPFITEHTETAGVAGVTVPPCRGPCNR